MIGMGKVKLASAALAALALYGCGEGEQPPPPAPAPLPAQICDKAREELGKLAKTGTFEFVAGEATIEEAVWLSMAPQQRDALVQGLGFHTACERGPAAETSVIIKNEGGRVLSQRVVETSADLTRALQQ